MKALSIAKLDEGVVNEDAVIAREGLIAVSDGAGGGGVFADRWSKYLVEHLPNEPFADFETFDNWIDGIWEPFYDDCEELAKQEGGMLLNKFYDEGSFATLVAAWKDGQWMSFGDSVAFCYHQKTGKLQHSFSKLADFNNPPYLVNCKDPLDSKGFKSGKLELDDDCIVFAASDTLAHYILMMYEVANKEEFAEELQIAINAQTKNSNFIRTALSIKRIDFNEAFSILLRCIHHPYNFTRHLSALERRGLIARDDYSIALL